ncbi:hypothetical protein [Microbacterium sp. P5_E9]
MTAVDVSAVATGDVRDEHARLAGAVVVQRPPEVVVIAGAAVVRGDADGLEVGDRATLPDLPIEPARHVQVSDCDEPVLVGADLSNVNDVSSVGASIERPRALVESSRSRLANEFDSSP